MSEPEKLRLGGMALRNGLLVHGPTHWAAAVRAPDGTIRVASGAKPKIGVMEDVPGVRGVLRLGEALAVIPLVRRALPEARLAFENPAVLGVAASATLASSLLRRRAGNLGDAAAVAVSMVPAFFALRGGELAAYHGAEHKSIGAYEACENAANTSKEHDRCGSHLVTPMLASNLAGMALARQALEKPGPVAGGVVSLASTAVAVEVFAWTERNDGTALARALRRPGYELQRLLGTREPDDRHLEVARAALSEVLRVEAAPAAAT